jgi:hypothetical protein
VLSGEITIKNGAVEQSNFHDYRVLRMANAPDVEVHLVPVEKIPPTESVNRASLPLLLLSPTLYSQQRESASGACRSIPRCSQRQHLHNSWLYSIFTQQTA